MSTITTTIPGYWAYGFYRDYLDGGRYKSYRYFVSFIYPVVI